MILEEYDGLIRRHDAPRRLRKLVAGRAVGIQLRDVLAIDAAELVANADKCELGDVGGAARAVAFPEVVSWRERFATAADDFEKDVRQRSAFARQRGVHATQNVIELHLLDMLRCVDTKSGHTQTREHERLWSML